MRKRLVLGAVWLLAGSLKLSSLAPAHAEAAGGPARLALEWQAPPRCPDRVALLADVEGLLAHARNEGNERLHARGTIAASRVGYTLKLEVDGARRELEGGSCEDLARAAALLIALVLNPQLQVAPVPPLTATSSRPPSAPATTSPSAPATTSPSALPASSSNGSTSSILWGAPPPHSHSHASPSYEIGWEVGGAFLDIGTFPTATVIGAVGAAWERSGVRLGARLLLAAPSYWDSGSTGRVTFQAFGASTRVCISAPTIWWRAGLCAGMEALRVDAEGSGLTGLTRGGAWELAAATSADLRLRVWEAWFLAAEAGILAPCVRLHFIIDGGADHRSDLALRAGLFATRAFKVF